jgi:hypothetical protein
MPFGHPSRGANGSRIEPAIRIVAPVLDAVLLVGDRVSRILFRDDPDYVPARMPSPGEAAPRGLRHPIGGR